jgi:hypothetical protein
LRGKNIEDPLCLDIGTGTGFLAMLCLRHGCKRVIACEMFPLIADLAVEVMASNHFKPQIFRGGVVPGGMVAAASPGNEGRLVAVLPRRSDEIEMTPDRADLCVSELLDHCLIGEGIIPTMRHAWEHLLKPGAAVIPAGGAVFVQIVHFAPFDRLGAVSDTTYPAKADAGEFWTGFSLSRSAAAGACSAERGYMPIHWNCDTVRAGTATSATATPLSAPLQSFSFTWNTHHPPSLRGRAATQKWAATRTGVANAVLLWWDLNVHREHTYTTNPHRKDASKGGNWQDHWQQALYPLGQHTAVTEGQEWSLSSSHADTELWFEIKPLPVPSAKGCDDRPPAKKARKGDTDGRIVSDDDGQVILPIVSDDDGQVISPPHCSCGVHSLYNTERLLHMNDPLRTRQFSAAVQSWFRTHSRTDNTECNLACIIDVSDGSWCSLLMATCPLCPEGVAMVSLDTHELSAIVFEQIARHQGLSERVQIAHVENVAPTLDGHLDNLKAGVTNVILLTGEPFYHKMVGREDMQCLNYWHIVSSLRRKFHAANPALDICVQSLPARARVRGMAVRFKHLADAYGRHGTDDITAAASNSTGIGTDGGGGSVTATNKPTDVPYCGFDHAAFEKHRSEAMGSGGIPMYTWMYDYTPASEPFEIFEMDFSLDPSKQAAKTIAVLLAADAATATAPGEAVLSSSSACK